MARLSLVFDMKAFLRVSKGQQLQHNDKVWLKIRYGFSQWNPQFPKFPKTL